MVKNLNKQNYQIITKQIHWIRHAETFSNTSELNYQIIDPHLTSKGIEQCFKLKKQFEDDNFFSNVELVVVSPLFRTLETASNIFDSLVYKAKFICLEEIREQMNKPCHKRKPIHTKKNLYKYIDFSTLTDIDTEFDKHNLNENINNVIKRIKWFLNWIETRKEKNIVVITHGNFLLPLFNKVLPSMLAHSNIINNHNNLSNDFFNNCECKTTIIKYKIYS